MVEALYHILKTWSSGSKTTFKGLMWFPSQGRSGRRTGLSSALTAWFIP